MSTGPKPRAKFRDYSLTGPESALAVKKGLASGTWWVPHIDRKVLRRLSKRTDYYAVRDTVILFSILLFTGSASVYFWNRSQYVMFSLLFWTYCTFYNSSGDSRWHECGHGTAFKTRWMNDWMYEIASFMVFRLPEAWRFSHSRHHTDTGIVGRDPEIDARPLSMWTLFLAFFSWHAVQAEAAKLWSHANGCLSPAERTYIPPSEHPACIRKARIWLSIYMAALVATVLFQQPLVAMFVFLPYWLGAWHLVMVGVFQHASLEHDVLDHRLNSRTCYLNPISAFIYWNMHYHIEHHTFPMVPYYNLPELHKILKPQMPKPYGSIFEVYYEMIPDLIKQNSDPQYFTKRDLHIPPPLPSAARAAESVLQAAPDKDGWMAACTVDEVELGEVIRLDVGPRTYCVYHAEDDGLFYATAGKCTHGAALLAEGLVDGNLIECPKHNGCFDFKTGLPKRAPVRTKLATFPTRVEDVFGVKTVYVQVNTSTGSAEIAYDEM